MTRPYERHTWGPDSSYPTGKTSSDKQLATIAIDPHRCHGEWNYTLTGLQPSLDL